ncbi:MAG TPA: FAD binding domain-containing protein [Candidatus Limnocylindria bacterium]|nr:FAD binding domain-containing protein [Candidatus Limnocylindria bacterium]
MPNAVEPPIESPTRLEAALDLLADAAGPPWRPLAGGTDLMVQITGELGEPPERILDIWGLDELRGIGVEGDALVIGALSTYTEIRSSPVVAEFVPALVEAAATIGAAQIQNRGTIGGNAINASPAGDTLPLLLALGATFVLGSAGGEREVGAGDFWPAYRTTARRDDELLFRIRIPLVADRQVRFRKIGTRRAQAISKVVMALAWQAAAQGSAWADVRLALGSVAATTVRAPSTEAALEGKAPTRETADAAVAALAAELHPIDDVRSTADYRRLVAGRVLHRLIRDEGGW